MLHYYSALARDAMLADVIFVIGSGLGDLHLNAWLGQARLRNPLPPLLVVDWWQDGFIKKGPYVPNRKEAHARSVAGVVHSDPILTASAPPGFRTIWPFAPKLSPHSLLSPWARVRSPFSHLIPHPVTNHVSSSTL
jgi:hypothetical protein